MEAIKLIPTIVLSLVIAGLAVTAGVRVISNFRSNTVDNLDTVTITDEFTTAVGVTLTPAAVTGGGILTGVTKICVNKTTNESECNALVLGTDYNTTDIFGYHGTGVITLRGNLSGNLTNMTYTYQRKDALLNATEDSMSGTTGMSQQFGTISIIASMVIILMMIGGLTAYFGLR